MVHRKLYPGIVLLILFSLITGCSPNPQTQVSQSTPVPKAAVPIKPTYTVQRGEVATKVEFSSEIAPIVEKELFFRSDGRIRKVYFKKGDMVKQGDLLADLEILNGLERQQALSQIQVKRVEIALEMAKLRLKMSKEAALKPDNDALVLQTYEVTLAELDLEQVKLNNEDLGDTIDSARIVSPINGKILSINLLEGYPATAYKAAVVVGDITSLELRSELDTTTRDKIVKGMPLEATAVYRPGVSYKGIVTGLPGKLTSGEMDTYTHITLESDPTQDGMSVGDRLTVVAIVEISESTLWLPPQAVRVFEGRTFVVIQDGDVQRRVDVKQGIKSEDRVEILEGLTEGQIVVAP